MWCPSRAGRSTRSTRPRSDGRPIVSSSTSPRSRGAVARVRGLPWASSSTPALVAASAGPLGGNPDFARRRLDPLQREHGLEPVDWPYLSRSSSRQLRARIHRRAAPSRARVRLVGATSTAHAARRHFPGTACRRASRVRVARDERRAPRARLFGTLADALGGLDAQVIVSAPTASCRTRPKLRRGAVRAANELLTHVDAVISHAGHNTVVEALVHGRPCVLVPMAYDQPYNASRVVVGRRRRSAATTAAHGGPARRTRSTAVLADPGLRLGGAAARRRTGRGRRRPGGADALEGLAGGGVGGAAAERAVP